MSLDIRHRAWTAGRTCLRRGWAFVKCDSQDWALIILRNARTHWKPSSLTVQELINSKLCFLGLPHLQFLATYFPKSFLKFLCGIVQGEKAGGHRSRGGGSRQTLWLSGGSEGCRCVGVSLIVSDLELTRELRNVQDPAWKGTPRQSESQLPFRGGKRGLPSPLFSISGHFVRVQFLTPTTFKSKSS